MCAYFWFAPSVQERASSNNKEGKEMKKAGGRKQAKETQRQRKKKRRKTKKKKTRQTPSEILQEGINALKKKRHTTCEVQMQGVCVCAPQRVWASTLIVLLCLGHRDNTKQQHLLCYACACVAQKLYNALTSCKTRHILYSNKNPKSFGVNHIPWHTSILTKAREWPVSVRH